MDRNRNGPWLNGARKEIQDIYRAVADGRTREDVLSMIYDLFGASSDLRPPSAEIRLADRCKPNVGA
jgi:hypothetical protein